MRSSFSSKVWYWTRMKCCSTFISHTCRSNNSKAKLQEQTSACVLHQNHNLLFLQEVWPITSNIFNKDAKCCFIFIINTWCRSNNFEKFQKETSACICFMFVFYSFGIVIEKWNRPGLFKYSLLNKTAMHLYLLAYNNACRSNMLCLLISNSHISMDLH